ncbi:MAG: hypothetical protein AB7S44_04035 [Spirochaetales bacterium]
MKTKILSVFFSFILIVGLLSGCYHFTPLTGGPLANDLVTGNGGSAVVKGDYLYFMNGYLSVDDLTEGDNDYGDEENGALYRAELNTDGSLMTDEEGNLLNVELLVPKLVGFENGGIYIFDNYIYYASPTILKDKAGDVRFDLVDFYRAKLDGTGITKIYATNAYDDGSEFAFYKIDGSVYLVVFDGTSVVSVKVGSSVSSPVTMVETATSVILPKVTTYDATNNVVADINKYVYYTRDLDSAVDNTIIDSGNVLAKVQIGATTEQVLMRDNIWTYSLGNLKNSALYYTKYSSNSSSSKNYFRIIENGSLSSTEVQVTGTYYSSITVLDFANGNNRGVVVSDGNRLLLITDITTTEGIEILVDEEATLLFGKGDYVYYAHGDNNRIARINIITKVIDELSAEDETINVDSSLKIDYDDNYIYFLQTHTNEAGDSIYLERVQISTTAFESEFVGVLESDDLPDEVTE